MVDTIITVECASPHDNIDNQAKCKIFASIPPIPPSKAPGLLDNYMAFLAAHSSQLSGIAIYNIFPDYPITQYLPDELSQLPVILVPTPLTPHDILAAILTDQVSLFTAGGLVSTMTDLGIALDFHLTHSSTDKDLPLGIDLFSSEHEERMSPLVDSCTCFTCRKYHAAYVHHLLNCHEMTAWILLQMYSSLLPKLTQS
jgi:queuine tRNA-ribosyltransferase accessory subunit